jgi:hypothetical protein
MNKGWFIVALIEIIALAIGVALYYFGFVAWYIVPLFLLMPPGAAVVALIVGLMIAQSRGQNPFQ